MPAMSWFFESVRDLFERGGWTMYPLGLLSLVGLTLIFERVWFFARTNSGGQRRRVQRVGEHLRKGEATQASAMIRDDGSVYGELVRQLIAERATDAAATDAVERQRPRLERFMPLLGTIITAAPMLGILGTVLGIIKAFDVLGGDKAVTDPASVGTGIGEALLTTVVGLIVALVVLFPYNWFRAQIERTLGRMESLIASAQQVTHGSSGGDDGGSA